MKAAISLIPLCLLSFWACKAEPGGACRSDEARCSDAAHELVCDDGKFVETPCKGKGGCVTERERTACDIAGNAPGDACAKVDEGAATCLAADVMLACHGRKFERVPCRGPRGCVMSGQQASCDQSIADQGESCKKPGAKACSADASQVLECVDGRMAARYVCRGAGRCSSAGGKLGCDQSVAQRDDPCDPRLSGHIACSEDKQALLVCKDERFALSEKCRRGTRCAVNGQSTSCEKP